MSDALSKAKKNYTRWHQKNPKEVVEATYDFPETVVDVGRAVRIIYSSDKWEKDGDNHLYEHKFDSRPSVYTEAKGGVRTNPGAIEVPTKRLLSVDSFRQQLALPVLATVVELVYHDGSKERETSFGNRQPLLCAALDMRTLVIFDIPRPFFIKGGEMTVTERGIVK